MRRLATRYFDVSPFSINGHLTPIYLTELGALFKGDCVQLLPHVRGECVDTVFADPPFNIGKEYGRGVDDRRTETEYVDWCRKWIDECIRVLKPGGSFFLYNIPKWNMILSNYLLEKKMHFRDWIVVDIKMGLPIHGRLYPSHYSLLYFSKGRHKTFHNIRTPIKLCRHCGGEVKDYGGHRQFLNPKGLNLTDVWDDIHPVRHKKFKSQDRKANSLSSRLLERVISMSTNPGDLVLDPFGGGGTTFAVCEKKKRQWIGMEIGRTKVIIDRIKNDAFDYHKNDDVVE
jgi:site-specific DNA-methyltransferase (adenine-specific)